MDDWNDFGNIPHPPANPHSSHSPPDMPYPTSSSHSSLTESSVVLDYSSSSASDQPSPASNPPNAQDVHNDRGSFLSSLSFLPSRKRSDARREPLGESPPDHLVASPSNKLPFDHAIVPLDRSGLADRAIDDSTEHISLGSGSDARDEPFEPKSVCMPKKTRVAPIEEDAALEEFPAAPPTPQKGPLDIDQLDYEFNIEGFRMTARNPLQSSSTDGDGQSSVLPSSAVRLHKTYTKLEVITAKEIKSLVMFFNLFVVIAILYTLTLIILSHKVFSSSNLIPLPERFLTEEQIAEAGPPQNVSVEVLDDVSARQIQTSGATFFSFDILALSRMRKSENSVAAERAIAAAAKNQMACHGLYWNRDGLYTGEERQDLCATPQQPTSTRQVVAPGDFKPGEGPPDNPANALPVPPTGIPTSQSGEVVRLYFVEKETAILGKDWKKASHFITFFLSVFFFILGGLFAVRLYRAGSANITHEQVWVLILIINSAIYLNAFESVLRLIEEFNFKPQAASFAAWVPQAEEVIEVVRDTAFAVVSYFYLWVSFHSYRILDPTARLGFRQFYLPKLLVLGPYCLFLPLAYFLADLRLSEVPMLSAPALAFYYGEFRVWNYLLVEAVCAILKSVYELILTIIIIVEATRTMRVLEEEPYMKYRTKRVGFRFFLYINFVFYALFLVLQCALLFGKPKGENIFQLDFVVERAAIDVLFFWTVGTSILLSGYILCTAYVHLPCTSVGVIKGWFMSSELGAAGFKWSFSSQDSRSDSAWSVSGTEAEEKLKTTTWTYDDSSPSTGSDRDFEVKQKIVEPYTYRIGESKDCLQLKANCFTMQTHVIMFNFAWYVYYYGTPKIESFRPKQSPLPFAFKIAAHVRSETTDTQALVIDCADRIIVTFRGTTSMKNLRTSLHMNHEKLSTVMRTRLTGEDEYERLKGLFGGSYERAKIHKGFAVAYLTVANDVAAAIGKLREKSKRPVFMTGHSLGGALATICSLDLWVKLDISRRELFVSTFGSPRVGNSHFADVYGNVVPLHWRIVVHPDMVSKLPRVGYTHVGKKVVMTPHGDMLIDPNALEQRPWSGEAAAFAYHRKASYMLAIRAWCLRNHENTYTPVFWPFPTRPDDNRRFAAAFKRVGGGPGKGVAAKIIRLDAMVDSLGRNDTGLANMAVVEKWGRLARRLLLNYKLTRSEL